MAEASNRDVTTLMVVLLRGDEDEVKRASMQISLHNKDMAELGQLEHVTLTYDLWGQQPAGE